MKINEDYIDPRKLKEINREFSELYRKYNSQSLSKPKKSKPQDEDNNQNNIVNEPILPSLSVFEQQFSEALEKIGIAREAILNLYDNFLYEDWSEDQTLEFEDQMKIYNDNINIVKENLPNVHWNSEEERKQFMRKYLKLVQEDNEAFNLAKIRHESYLTYRTNRKSLITQLNNICGFVKTKNGKKLLDVFNYLNNRCAKIPLFGNPENNHQSLYQWGLQHMLEMTDDINDSPSIEDSYSKIEVTKIFLKYLHCRYMVFTIFNMITSSNKINGYEKWHNILDPYCEADLKDYQLEKLYNAANAEDDIIKANEYDDYQQILDDKSWALKHIYENWFTDEMQEYYSSHKQKKSNIKKINMLGDDANQCKIATDGKYVYSTCNFYPDDIIEICPTKQIDKSALYSKDMRNIVFEVIPNTEWVIPFGYCQYYDISNEEDKSNCKYIWDPIKHVIVIRATKKIPKFSQLILNNVNKILY